MFWLTNGPFVGAVSKTGAPGVPGINLGPIDPGQDKFAVPMLDMMAEEGVKV